MIVYYLDLTFTAGQRRCFRLLDPFRGTWSRLASGEGFKRTNETWLQQLGTVLRRVLLVCSAGPGWHCRPAQRCLVDRGEVEGRLALLLESLLEASKACLKLLGGSESLLLVCEASTRLEARGLGGFLGYGVEGQCRLVRPGQVDRKWAVGI